MCAMVKPEGQLRVEVVIYNLIYLFPGKNHMYVRSCC